MKVKSILVSQPEPTSDSSPYHELAKKEKVKVEFKPFIEVKGLSVRDVRSQKVDLSKYTAIVFTSRNAVDHYFRIAEEMRFHVPDAMKYFCQSEAIAYYLQKYIVYRKRKVYIGGKAFVDLTPLLKKHKDEKYLVPSADNLKVAVPNTLNEAKVEWTRLILYKTVSTDISDIKSKEYDIMAFFSPSGIQTLLDNYPEFKDKEETVIATFGKSTIEAAKKGGLKVTIPVPTPETPSMAMALEKYIKKVNGKTK